MIHVIHTLITVPVTPSLRSKWLPPLSNPASPRSSSKPISPVSSPPAPDSPTGSGRSESPSKDGKEKQGAFDRAFSRLSVARKGSFRASSLPPTQDTLLRAYDLLDVTLSHYLPGDIDPDDSTVRERCQSESDSTLDDLVCPLVLLITKLCSADEGARKRMREWIVPDDLDRTTPLEARADLLGRSLRLLACIHHSRLKDATGEMLYAICDSDRECLPAKRLVLLTRACYPSEHTGVVRRLRQRRGLPLQQGHHERAARQRPRPAVHDARRHPHQPHHRRRAAADRLRARDDGRGEGA